MIGLKIKPQVLRVRSNQRPIRKCRGKRPKKRARATNRNFIPVSSTEKSLLTESGRRSPTHPQHRSLSNSPLNLIVFLRCSCLSLKFQAMAQRQVGFIGAGNVFAAHIFHHLQLGDRILVAPTPGHNGIIPAIQANNNTVKDENTGSVCQVTVTDVEGVVQCGIIYITTANGHGEIANLLKDFDLSEKTMVIIAGGFFSACAVKHIRRGRFPQHIIKAAMSPYASRVIQGTNRVVISGTKSVVAVACSTDNISKNSSLSSFVCSLFPSRLEWVPSMTALVFQRDTSIFHLYGQLAMVEYMQANPVSQPRKFYLQCVPKKFEQIEVADEERVRIARALDYPAQTNLEIGKERYGVLAATFREFVTQCPAYQNIMAAATTNTRYFWEEIPIIEIYRKIARGLNIPTPGLDNLVQAVETATENRDAKNHVLTSLGLLEANWQTILATINAAARG